MPVKAALRANSRKYRMKLRCLLERLRQLSSISAGDGEAALMRAIALLEASSHASMQLVYPRNYDEIIDVNT